MKSYISADIALAAHWYCEATGDAGFRDREAAALQIETARFWESFITYNRERKRREILGIRGPDEFHFPVDNNVYTNALAAENLRLGAAALRRLRSLEPDRHKALCAELALSEDTPGRWDAVAENLWAGIPRDAGVIEQFDGYFSLPDVPLKRTAEGAPVITKTIMARRNDTQTIKQADVLLLLKLFPGRFSRAILEDNYRYYVRRDALVSSLSPGTNATIGAWLGADNDALRSFRLSASRDLTPGAESGAGIHAACLGNTWQAAVNGFGGFTFDGGTPSFAPHLPKEWRRLSYRVRWQGRIIEVVADHDACTVTLLAGKTLTVRVYDEDVTLTPRSRAKTVR